MTKEEDIEVVSALWKMFSTELLDCTFEPPPEKMQKEISLLDDQQLRGAILHAAIELQKRKPRR